MTKSWEGQLKSAIDDQFDTLVQLRRHLHKYPEPSGQESQTSFRIYQELGDRGFQVSLGPEGCGVVADLGGADSTADGTGRIAIRADLDALQIQDEKVVSYRSRCPGVMHACGHDAHTSIVFGALSAIASLHRDGVLSFQPRLRGVFQPAEETCQGARQMIDAGALSGVRAMLATHVDPTLALGRIGLRRGVLTANCDEVRITVRGRGGHAARPHESIDPISAAANLINTLYLQIPRSVDSLESVVFTVGTINGGLNANVIPDHVDLGATLRTLDGNVRLKTKEMIERIARSIADGSQTEIDVEYGISAHAVHNDASIVNLLEKSSRHVVGVDSIDTIARPSMGSEDFAFFASEVPSAMFRLGCTSDRFGGAGLHSSTFDIDEEALRIGSHLMAHTALAWMERELKSSSGADDPAAQLT